MQALVVDELPITVVLDPKPIALSPITISLISPVVFNGLVLEPMIIEPLMDVTAFDVAFALAAFVPNTTLKFPVVLLLKAHIPIAVL